MHDDYTLTFSLVHFFYLLAAIILFVFLYRFGKKILMKTYYSDDPMDYFDYTIEKKKDIKAKNYCHKHPSMTVLDVGIQTHPYSPCTFCGCQCGSCDCRHG